MVFAGLSVVALVFYLVVGRHVWFFFDEWNFLAGRTLNVHGLLDDHGGHLVMLPVIVFRALFFVFGLRSYLPYQVVIVVLHITTAWLLRAVMRRSGVRPLTATAAASLFLFFGSGAQNILQAFQITFVGALAFGLVQLLLADHDGPIDRRDWLGLAAGFGAIACSGVGLTMLGVVAVAVLVRRGCARGALHAVPPFVVWVIWHSAYSKNNPTTTNAGLIFHWSRLGLAGTFNAMGQVPFVGWLLAAVLVAGLVLAARTFPHGWRRDAAIPVAFLAGAAAFLVTTGISRLWAGLAGATQNRYLYIVAALLLPPLALAADAIARRWRGLGRGDGRAARRRDPGQPLEDHEGLRDGAPGVDVPPDDAVIAAALPGDAGAAIVASRAESRARRDGRMAARRAALRPARASRPGEATRSRDVHRCVWSCWSSTRVGALLAIPCRPGSTAGCASGSRS